MSQFLAIIGLVSGILGIFQFGEDHLPDKPEEPAEEDPNKYGTIVRVWAGLDGSIDPNTGDSLSGSGGIIDRISHYDNANPPEYVVSSLNYEEIEDGGWLDYEGWTSTSRQAAVSEVWGSTKTCIATMGITLSDGLRFGWTGDWGEICNALSYYSGILMADGSVPYCMWVSYPGDEHIAVWKFSVDWAEFLAGDEEPTEEEAQAMCGTAFKAWTFEDDQEVQILEPTDPDTISNGPPSKRSRAIGGRSDDRLIVSRIPNQNATTLCARDHSHGPDFVSLDEGVYCNMETRETLPVCAPGVVGECFDVEEASHVETNGKTKRTIQARNPIKVLHWG